MYSDFKELLSSLNAHGVKYLVVGGHAVSFYAQPRATKDIDILIQPNTGNSRAVFAALAEFGVPLRGLTPESFAERGKFFRMGREPIAVDILSEIPGVDFDCAWERRVPVRIDDITGQMADFIAVPDLIAAKIAAGRPQDLADVAALRKAAERPSE